MRDIFAAGADDPERIHAVVDDAYITSLAKAVGGELGGRTGVAPRLFLKKLIADVLDRVELFEDFNPRLDYRLTVDPNELSEVERAAHVRGAGGAVGSVDDIDLEL